MKIDDIKTIAKLKLEGKFDEIYKLYGRKVYLATVSDSYKNKDIKNLLNEGRFLDLYEKYGEQTYNKYINKIRKRDIENELGVNFGFINYLFFEKVTHKLRVAKDIAIKTGINLAIAGISLSLSVSAAYDNSVKENASIYSDEIDQYNNEIKSYAKKINDLNLSDLEIIIKVMNDMWSNIKGYKNPSNYDEMGYQRLSLYMNGYGVCRNMADDFTARMNAINPDYEACNMNVYINDAHVNNIKRTIIEENNTVSFDNETSEILDSINNLVTNTFGNHMVTCMKLKVEDVLLVVDVTNPSIGVLKDGQIYMLSNQVMDGLDIKPISNIMLGQDNRKSFLKKVSESYTTQGDIESLKEKYGIYQQNQTLEQIIKNYSTDSYKVK